MRTQIKVVLKTNHRSYIIHFRSLGHFLRDLPTALHSIYSRLMPSEKVVSEEAYCTTIYNVQNK